MPGISYINSRGEEVSVVDSVGSWLVSIYTVNNPGAPEPEFFDQGSGPVPSMVGLASELADLDMNVVVAPMGYFETDHIPAQWLDLVTAYREPIRCKVNGWTVNITPERWVRDGLFGLPSGVLLEAYRRDPFVQVRVSAHRTRRMFPFEEHSCNDDTDRAVLEEFAAQVCSGFSV